MEVKKKAVPAEVERRRRRLRRVGSGESSSRAEGPAPTRVSERAAGRMKADEREKEAAVEAAALEQAQQTHLPPGVTPSS